MLLATRCPNCHTVFRVVADQLKLRNGLVRCGTCQHVFDGRTELCAPPEEIADAPSSPTVAPTPVSKPQGPRASIYDAIVADDEPRFTTPPGAPANLDAAALLRHEDKTRGGGFTSAPLSARAADPADAPPWLRNSARSRKGVLWVVAVAVLTLSALLQLVWWQRDALAAQWPPLRGPLMQLCQIAGCRIAPVRQLSGLNIESTNLATEGDDSDAQGQHLLVLTLFLRNTSDHAIAYPALELTLMDASGTPVVRRDIHVTDYLSDSEIAAGLAARSEHPIRLRLSAHSTTAANYHVVAFYP